MPGFYSDLYAAGNQIGRHIFDPELFTKVTGYDAVKESITIDGDVWTWRNKANGKVVCTFFVHVDNGKLVMQINQLIDFSNPEQNTLIQYEQCPFGRRP